MQFGKIKGVIFDLDGTLLDTREGIWESVRHTLVQFGLKPVSDTDLSKFVGPPIQESLVRVAGLDPALAQDGADCFRDYYKTTALLKARPYEGILQLMKDLRQHGLKCAVSTFKREDYAITLLRHFGIADLCDAIHGGDNLNVLKKKDIISLSCREVGLNPDEAIYVGDTLNDAMSAHCAGLGFVGVSWGFGFLQEDSCPVGLRMAMISRPAELMQILKGEYPIVETHV